MSHTLPASPLPRPGEPSGDLVLAVVASPDAGSVGRVLPLTAQPWSIGRADDADVSVADDRMTRLHAVLRPAGPRRFEIAVLGSRNGLFVDGRGRRSAPLEPGTVLRLGDTLLVAREPDDGPGGEAVTALVGASPLIRRVRRGILRVARSDLTVLVTGETGTGKELVASEVHRLGGRAGAFVAVNCAAIPPSLAESTLFGHQRGAFTGATERREGLFAQADRGTLFLDEVGELPTAVQSKLLRVLEDGVVLPVGATRASTVDVRLVAATNVEIRAAVDTGGFRGDLLARLEEWPIELPALRVRREDVCMLLQAFLLAESPLPPPAVPADVAEALLVYGWPFNVRELRKLARRLRVALEPEAAVRLGDLPAPIVAALQARRDGVAEEAAEPVPHDGAAALTPDRVREALAGCLGNVTRAARMLGCGRKTLYRRLAEYDIDPDGYRP